MRCVGTLIKQFRKHTDFDCRPVSRWRNHAVQFPKLAAVARIAFALTPSSASVLMAWMFSSDQMEAGMMLRYNNNIG